MVSRSLKKLWWDSQEPVLAWTGGLAVGVGRTLMGIVEVIFGPGSGMREGSKKRKRTKDDFCGLEFQ